MVGAPTIAVSGAVEGITDDAVLRRLLDEAGILAGPIYIGSGKPKVLQNLAGYNNAARFSPWLVLLDLNGGAACAPEYRDVVLPAPAPHMHLRLAVRQVESWFLADAHNLSDYLKVMPGHIPKDPDAEGNAKNSMVTLAQRSRSSSVKTDMVPRPGSGRSTGPAYSSRLIEFVNDHWDPASASDRSDSLRRCRNAIARLADP